MSGQKRTRKHYHYHVDITEFPSYGFQSREDADAFRDEMSRFGIGTSLEMIETLPPGEALKRMKRKYRPPRPSKKAKRR